MFGFVFCIAILLCMIFSCGLILKSSDTVNAGGGIYVEDGANLKINGGVISNNDKAIVIEGGEYIIENLTISDSANGAIHLAGGGNINC